MEVEVFLYVDQRDVVLSEELTNASSISGLITGDLVAIEDRWKSSNIVCQGVELSCILTKYRKNKWEQRQENVVRKHLVRDCYEVGCTMASLAKSHLLSCSRLFIHLSAEHEHTPYSGTSTTTTTSPPSSSMLQGTEE